MRAPYTQLYVHLVWATWDRDPLIDNELQKGIFAACDQKCRELGCELIAIGGVIDHVHLLVQFNSTISVAELVKEIKGVSSHLVNHVLRPDCNFRWQGGYGAFTYEKAMWTRSADISLTSERIMRKAGLWRSGKFRLTQVPLCSLWTQMVSHSWRSLIGWLIGLLAFAEQVDQNETPRRWGFVLLLMRFQPPSQLVNIHAGG